MGCHRLNHRSIRALAYTFLKPEEEKPSYLTAPVEVGDIENNVMASGKVKALNTVDVGAQVSGEVTNLYVEVGDEVKQGDLIAQIDQVTQKNSLSNEQASLEQSEAALQSAQAESLSKQASLKVPMLILPAVSLSLNKHSLILHVCKT